MKVFIRKREIPRKTCCRLLGNDSRGKLFKKNSGFQFYLLLLLAVRETAETAPGHSGSLINRYSSVGMRSESVTPGRAMRDCLSLLHLSPQFARFDYFALQRNDGIRSDMSKEVALAVGGESAGRYTHTRGRRQTRRCMHIPIASLDWVTFAEAVQVFRGCSRN